MTADDKCGIGSGLLALGLAAGMIFLAQYLPNGLFGFHREMVNAEAAFDAIVFVIGFPAGLYLFFKGATSG